MFTGSAADVRTTSDCHAGMIEEADKVTAERLTLISHVDWLELDEPVFLQAGERYWLDSTAACLVVEDTSGPVEPYRGMAGWTRRAQVGEARICRR